MRSAGSNRPNWVWQKQPAATARAAARRSGAPGWRRARWCAPRCAPGLNPAARHAVPAPETDVKPGELTGAFATPPVPRAALVTGGARRIGRALALALAEA